LGFIWDADVYKWDVGFSYLLNYKSHFVNILNRTKIDGFNIGVWVQDQRYRYKKNDLSQERIEKLELLDGWEWDALEQVWNAFIFYLKMYKKVNGHTIVTRDNISEDEVEFELGYRVSHYRAEYKKGNLSKEKVDELNSLGFVWDVKEHLWQNGFLSLLDYKKTYGHINFVNSAVIDNYPIGSWRKQQRRKYKQDKLTPEQIKKLESVDGWKW
jgi:hypothetical protein